MQPTAASRAFYGLTASCCSQFLQTIYRSSPLRPAGSSRKIRTYLVEPMGSQKKLWRYQMKPRISLLLPAFALAVSSSLTAHASACSNSTVRGSYAFTIHGTLFLPNGSTLLIDGIAKETFDGEGVRRKLMRSRPTATSLLVGGPRPAPTP